MSGHHKWESIKHKSQAARYQVIGLAGQQGAGKDYVYQTLLEAYPERRVLRMGFADGVRREVAREVVTAMGFDVGDDAGMGTWEKPYTEGQRWILQQWGTEYRRAQDPEYWINYGVAYIAANAKSGDLWCVTDVRFANEFQAIEDLAHGTTALVTASVDIRADRLGITATELRKRSNHTSEVIDFTPTHVIDNFDQPTVGTALAAWLRDA